MGDIKFDRTAVAGPMSYDTFGCDPYAINEDTPDRVRPDRRFVRQVYNSLEMRMPDGKRVQFWGFRDPDARGSDGDQPFPSPLIRVREGEVVHTELKSGHNTHTIHHHGIDPTTFNDGVGHLSFEVSGAYEYQWRPSYAGTYFYHCHKNTVLHFEMGMYGPLIVDPPEGPGRAFRGGPAYDVEKIWVPDDVDPKWRGLNHSAGTCGDDANLDLFRPEYFLISGVPAPRTMTNERVVVRAKQGQRILIRLINASYSLLVLRLGLPATVIGVDGRGLGRQDSPWSRPYPIAAGQALDLSPAQRYDLLLEATRPGEFDASIEFRDWVSGAIQANGRGVAASRIIVS